MKPLSKFKFTMAICALLVTTASFLQAEVLVVVNEANATSSIDKSTLSKILQGQQKFWEDGSSIELAVPSGNATEDEVLQSFANMNASRFKTHWRRLVFSGRAKDPSQFDSDSDMLTFVSENKNAIGFLSADTDPGSLKVLEVTD